MAHKKVSSFSGPIQLTDLERQRYFLESKKKADFNNKAKCAKVTKGRCRN